MTEKPFKIAIPDDRLALLKTKLDLTIFPDELEDSGRDYGVQLADIKRLVEYWRTGLLDNQSRTGFNWRAQEAALNAELPQFTRDIEVDGFGTLNIHYVHKRSERADAIPLCFVHGWPGSFLEARKVAPLLTEGAEGQPAFHVVALSLPGFGFSEQPHKRGFSIQQYTEGGTQVAHKLMLALGYDEYVAQGGDWGARPDIPANITLTPEEQEMRKQDQQFRAKEAGYYAVQGSTSSALNVTLNVSQPLTLVMTAKPQTLGYALTDSPAGLLAWIYEKLVTWTDGYSWTDDEVLTWISIYWFSRAGPTSSFRIYYENLHVPAPQDEASPIPLGFSFFPKELIPTPKPLRDLLGNVVFESAMHDKGGHFAAYEVPELLVGDIRKMFAKGGPAYGVVKGKDGY
ncbi:Alpha/Beta hydrolase protein [Schizophyllum commune]